MPWFSPEVRDALQLSWAVAAASVVVSLPLALVLGFLLARRDFHGKSLLSALLLAPLVLPPVVTGLLLLEVFGRSGRVGAALDAVGVHVAFGPVGAVLAAVVVGFPLFVLSVRAAWEAVDPRYEEVAATLGAPPVETFRRVVLPLLAPGLAAGAVLVFARALGEFGATIVLAGNVPGRTRTLALAVYAALDAPGGESLLPPLVALSLGSAVLAIVGFEALNRWQRRRLALDERG